MHSSPDQLDNQRDIPPKRVRTSARKHRFPSPMEIACWLLEQATGCFPLIATLIIIADSAQHDLTGQAGTTHGENAHASAGAVVVAGLAVIDSFKSAHTRRRAKNQQNTTIKLIIIFLLMSLMLVSIVKFSFLIIGIPGLYLINSYLLLALSFVVSFVSFILNKK